MIVTRLELVDFRNYRAAAFDFHPGITAVVGLNGQGKTNLAEAMAYLATLDSFRGAPAEALVRVGADAAVVRATVLHTDGREVLVELEISRQGRSRVQVNRQRLGRTRDLLGVMRATVFSPDDLALVKSGPTERRRFLDDTLVALAVKYDSMRLELDRIVRQRNVLLKQCGGRLNDETEATLDVWDAKFSDVGDRFGHARATLVARLTPMVAEAYDQLADRPSTKARAKVSRAETGKAGRTVSRERRIAEMRASRVLFGVPERMSSQWSGTAWIDTSAKRSGGKTWIVTVDQVVPVWR